MKEEKSAIFSENRKYRYVLRRFWEYRKGYVCFVCLNPSTADEKTDDPTIRRCIAFAKSWDYGGMVMVNLFAFRATDPKELKNELSPIGPRNDFYIERCSYYSDITIMAWGTLGAYKKRDAEVKRLLVREHYLVLTKGKHPGHPLYLKKDLKPIIANLNKK